MIEDAGLAFEDSIYIFRNKVPQGLAALEELLDMEIGELSSANQEQRAEYDILLCRFSMFYSREIDKQASLAVYAAECVKRLIAPIFDKQTGFTYDEKRMSAIEKTPRAKEYDNIRLAAEMKRARLASVSYSLNNLARAISRRTK